VLVALGGEMELVRAVDLGLSGIGQADDARWVLLVTNEKKTLASLGGPGDVRVSSLGGLLTLEVVRESLGLNGVSAEEEELLGGNEVPAGVCG
jgi:hypothetical protein